MTDVPPPDSPKPPRGRPRRPKGFDDEAVLSEEEVARRVDVRGGGAPRGPVERAPVRDRRPVSRPERTGARDSLLLIGLVIVGLVAVRLFLPEGPLTASATATPGGSQAAVATGTPLPSSGPTSLPTGGVITLPPTEFGPTASPEPVTAAPITAPPAPTPTLKPGQTPKPTPRPTRTPGSTPPPGSPTMTVTVTVINNHGGQSTSDDWTIFVEGGNSNPGSFTGSSSGTTVTLAAGQPYQVSEDPQTSEASGYTTVRSSHCGSSTGGTLALGQHVTCTITKYDQQAYLTVVTDVNGGSATAADWDVTVTGANVTPTSPRPGSASGTIFRLDAHAAFSVSVSGGPADYDVTKLGSCVGSAVAGEHLTCTLREDYNPPPTAAPPSPIDTSPPPSLGLVAFLLPPRHWRPHRWRSTPAG